LESMVELQLPQQQQLPHLIPQLRTTRSHNKSLCPFSQRLCVCSVPLHLPSSACVRSAFFFFWLAIYSQNAILKIKKCYNQVLSENFHSHNSTNFFNSHISVYGSST
jgi:hypothetical protein